jgi:ATP-dependent DNA ligase
LRRIRTRCGCTSTRGLGLLQVREVTVGVCDRFLVTVKNGVGPSAARHARTVLSGLLGLAARHDAIKNVLDFTALQRRLASAPRVARLVARQPASFVAFDILLDGGIVLAGRPLRDRRRALEQLIPLLAPPLQVTPATRDQDVAAVWLRDYTSADAGIEGLVIKGLGQPYRPDARVWLKVKTRSSADAIVGAVTGELRSPQRLILALPDAYGRLHVAGGTTPLSPAHRSAVSELVRPPQRPHPWPRVLPAGGTGALGGPRALSVTLVEPELVVEVAADAAFEHGRWRHYTRLLRIRHELSAGDVARPDEA